MTDSPTKIEKWAQNAIFTLIARGVMVAAGTALVPAFIGLLDMRSELKLMRAEFISKVEGVEIRLTARADASDRRLANGDQRQVNIDRRIDQITVDVNRLTTSTAVLIERLDRVIDNGRPITPK